MTTKLATYTLSDFHRIRTDGFNYELDPKTIELIQSIEKEVESRVGYSKPQTSTLPVVFNKRDTRVNVSTQQQPQSGTFDGFETKKKKTKKFNVEVKGDDCWKSSKETESEDTTAFKTIKIIHNMEDANIDAIRSVFNKISDKSYMDCRTKIVETIEYIISNKPEDLARVTDVIFDIASNNRYCSKLYSDMFSELVTLFSPIRKAFDLEVVSRNYIGLFEGIEDADPTVDYQKFVDLNTTSEKRKALSNFIVHLMSNLIIPKEAIFNLLCELIQRLGRAISDAAKIKEVDELTENIAILLSDLQVLKAKNAEKHVSDPKDPANSVTVMEFVQVLSQCKPRQFPGLTNKSIFKFMDIMDKERTAKKEASSLKSAKK
jgi:hypothetical protein